MKLSELLGRTDTKESTIVENREIRIERDKSINYECGACGATFNETEAHEAYDDPDYDDKNHLICPECGSDDIESIDTVTESVGVITVTNIKWDADEPEDVADLPTTVKIKIPSKIMDIEDKDERDDEIGDYVSDYLSDEYGFTHDGFSLNESEKMTESLEDLNYLKQLSGI